MVSSVNKKEGLRHSIMNQNPPGVYTHVIRKKNAPGIKFKKM